MWLKCTPCCNLPQRISLMHLIFFAHFICCYKPHALPYNTWIIPMFLLCFMEKALEILFLDAATATAPNHLIFNYFRIFIISLNSTSTAKNS